MKAAWNGWRARFARMSLRERGLVFAVVGVALVMGAEALVLEPLWLRQAALRKALPEQERERTTLQQVVGILAAPDAASGGDAARLRELEAQLAAQNGQLDRIRASLVNPRQMPALLESLLGRHPRLRLISLQTLPSEAVGGAANGLAPGSNAVQAGVSAALYRHPVELRVGGRYADLVDYVAALEGMRPRLLWDQLELDASRHPDIELRLRLHTLSEEAAWLAL
jgi:MSHA biogenesis protein MshJ